MAGYICAAIVASGAVCIVADNNVFHSISNRVYWLSYAAVSSAVLAPIFVLGLKHPLALETLLSNGGLIESLPAPIYLISAIASIYIALRLALYRKGAVRVTSIGWALYGAFCFFLAGEESAWGTESVLGWQMLEKSNVLAEDDAHNLISHLIASNLTLAVWISGLAVLSFAILLFGLISTQNSIFRRLVARFNQSTLSQKFGLLGCGLVLFGLVDILQELGFPYFKGQWALEESFELLGSVALLFAVVVKLLAPLRVASLAHKSALYKGK